jgi:hypothetical protein
MPGLADFLAPYLQQPGANFGTVSPQEYNDQTSNTLEKILAGANETARGAFEQSENLRTGGEYNAGPVVYAALMGVGPSVAGAPVGALGAGGGRMKIPEAPAIGGKAPLFDYSRLGDVPDVPQFDLPRYDPPRGVSERVGELVEDKAVQRGVLKAIDKGLSVGAERFYNQDPLLQEFQSELGSKKGTAAFGDYTNYLSATSPRSKVPENVRNASYYYVRDAQGEPILPWEEDPGQPAPYGHMAQKLQRQGAVDVQQGTWNPIKNPKPPSYAENLRGNLQPATIDAHAFNLPAMLAEDPRFLKGSFKPKTGAPTINPSQMFASGDLSMEEALKRPAFWAGQPNPNEYAALENYWRDLAQRKGLATGQGQAAGWTGGGELTGNRSSSLTQVNPILQVTEDRIARTAEARGLTKAQVLKQLIRGKAPLLSVPAGVAGANVWQDAHDRGLISDERYPQ